MADSPRFIGGAIAQDVRVKRPQRASRVPFGRTEPNQAFSRLFPVREVEASVLAMEFAAHTHSPRANPHIAARCFAASRGNEFFQEIKKKGRYCGIKKVRLASLSLWR